MEKRSTYSNPGAFPSCYVGAQERERKPSGWLTGWQLASFPCRVKASLTVQCTLSASSSEIHFHALTVWHV